MKKTELALLYMPYALQVELIEKYLGEP